jgi:hypothetical protein
MPQSRRQRRSRIRDYLDVGLIGRIREWRESRAWFKRHQEEMRSVGIDVEMAPLRMRIADRARRAVDRPSDAERERWQRELDREIDREAEMHGVPTRFADLITKPTPEITWTIVGALKLLDEDGAADQYVDEMASAEGRGEAAEITIRYVGKYLALTYPDAVEDPQRFILLAQSVSDERGQGA